MKLPRQVWTQTVMSSGTSRIAAFTASAYISVSFFGSSPRLRKVSWTFGSPIMAIVVSSICR
jgi:hypothetical protein